jgi:hypothetical protein
MKGARSFTAVPFCRCLQAAQTSITSSQQQVTNFPNCHSLLLVDELVRTGGIEPPLPLGSRF